MAAALVVAAALVAAAAFVAAFVVVVAFVALVVAAETASVGVAVAQVAMVEQKIDVLEH